MLRPISNGPPASLSLCLCLSFRLCLSPSLSLSLSLSFWLSLSVAVSPCVCLPLCLSPLSLCVVLVELVPQSWARAGCKKALCLLHYPRKIKFIHSFSLSLPILPLLLRLQPGECVDGVPRSQRLVHLLPRPVAGQWRWRCVWGVLVGIGKGEGWRGGGGRLDRESCACFFFFF